MVKESWSNWLLTAAAFVLVALVPAGETSAQSVPYPAPSRSGGTSYPPIAQSLAYFGMLAPVDTYDSEVEQFVSTVEAYNLLAPQVSATALSAAALSYAPVPVFKPRKISKLVLRDVFDEEDLTVKVTVDNRPTVTVTVPKGGSTEITLSPAVDSDKPLKIVIESEYNMKSYYNRTLSDPRGGKVVYDLDQELIISR